jgi:hypothetical protein
LVVNCQFLAIVYFFQDFYRQISTLLRTSLIVPEQDLQTLAKCKAGALAHISNH